MKRAVVALAVTALVATPAAAAPSWSWKALHRPLHVPRIDPGAACPVSPVSSVDLGAEGVQILAGRGPAYPNFGGGHRDLEYFWPALPAQTDFYGTGWSGNKVLWWVTGSYHGPVLIRGRQLDGTELVRFDRGRPPAAEIRIPPGRGVASWKGARDRPSYTRVRKPGCYAYQIDGATFSRVIVFEARVVPPPG
jgi:hypothetical protein